MRRVVYVGVILALVAAIVLALPGPAKAARFISDDMVVIGPEEVIEDDVYIAAQQVEVHGRIAGDLVVLARDVRISGQVDGDALLFAQVVDLRGTVNDDLRAAGAIVRVQGGQVGDDLMASGYSVEVHPASTVGGDVVAAGYQIYLAGPVQGNAFLAANGVQIDGPVGGDVRAEVGEGGGPPPVVMSAFIPGGNIVIVPNGLTLGPNARIQGNLTYRSLQEAHIDPQATVQGTVRRTLPARRQQAQPRPETQFGTLPWALHQARRWVALVVIGALLFLGLRSRAYALARLVSARPLAALGWGLVTVVGVIGVVVIMLLGTLIVTLIFSLATLSTLALWTAILGLAFDVFLVIAYLAYGSLLAPAVAGYGLLTGLDREGRLWPVLLPLALLAYVILSALPYVGWLVRLLVWLLAFGALVLAWRQRAHA